MNELTAAQEFEECSRLRENLRAGHCELFIHDMPGAGGSRVWEVHWRAHNWCTEVKARRPSLLAALRAVELATASLSMEKA